MKYLFCFFALLMVNYSVIGQKKIERYTINCGFTLPIYDAPNTLWETTIVPEIEFLFNLPLYKTVKLSTGIGIETGKHIVVEEVSGLTWVESRHGWWPYEVTHYWNLNFLSMEVPVYISVPFNNSFLDSFTFGAGWGWLLSYKLTEHQIPNTSREKINRSFLDVSFGLRKKLVQFNKASLSCTPGIGYRDYLTDRNDWQKKCVLGELKFNIDF